ncbi:MAG TPA: CtsR family transcriptional regulator [Candidatus Borkfalkia excrementavium]|uniref:CtsR family transcriptional regulator n=1 Tax=Candidatus Borkfalkia excrementavium TaxID=2838505 RepID=A0A9D1Z8E8_9FIRM|nr:CtsR family transcriptional regulator [Candidatus Borkfalkia excrementavium]
MNICDEIEKFLLDALGNEKSVLISRNSLSRHFDCAPSQINYVLTTRFGAERGFVTSSKRGGGGYIEIARVDVADGDCLCSVLKKEIGEELSFGKARGIFETLCERGEVSEREKRILLSALTDQALDCPLMLRDRLRARIVRAALSEIAREKKEG